jgi:rubredoxin
MANDKTVATKEEEKAPEIEEVTKDFNPPLDVPETVEAEPDPKVEEEPIIEDDSEEKPEKVQVRCPDCPWKAGLIDENTYCPTCNGTGKVAAEPLE